MTALKDFEEQYGQVLLRLQTELLSTERLELFVLTLPHYSSVGYLFDSEDLEYYLRKVNTEYAVPPTFKRVAAEGQAITDPLKGDRVSLLTFGFMYLLLHSGYSVDYVNQILEVDGEQQDGLVLSEEERLQIMSRIDAFNEAIRHTTESLGSHAHLVDTGSYLNDMLNGVTPVIVDNREFTRKWVRGSGFSLDGVHPGYTGQTLLANFVLEQINTALGIGAPLYDLASIMSGDVYVDKDMDGWAPGPDYQASGVTELLFLFRDPDDYDPGIQVELPEDVWELISDTLLRQILEIPSLRTEAERLGIQSPQTSVLGAPVLDSMKMFSVTR